MAKTDAGSLRITRVLIWTGPAWGALAFVGMVMARLLPPPSATKTGPQIAAVFIDHKVAIRLGICLLLISFTLFGTWGASIIMFMRRMEGGFPILTCTAVIMLAVGVMIFILSLLAWAVAAFRPDEIAPDITRAFHDLGWIVFVWPWAPFSAWWVLLGVAILNDRNTPPVFPRWIAWTCFWVSLLIVPAWTVLIFKDGPFAWNGAVSFYMPLVAFFAWLVNLTVFMLRFIQRELDAAEEGDARDISLVPTSGALS